MFSFNTKQFSIITLLLFIFFVPHISITSFGQKSEEADPLNLETLLGETTSTPWVLSGRMSEPGGFDEASPIQRTADRLDPQGG